MSSPVLWIVFPVILAILVIFMRRFKRGIYIFGIVSILLLVLSVWGIPIGESFSLGLPEMPLIEVSDSLVFLGVRFFIDQASKPSIILFVLATGIWFIGAYSARTNPLFIPLGLMLISMVVAALAVTPVFYATIFIELIALICVPLLSPPGHPIRIGVLRFLIFQTFGMGLLLLANWFFSTSNSDPENINFIISASITFSLGMALTLAIFPFHTWIPMLTEWSNPHAISFVLFILPTVISLLCFVYLNQVIQVEAVPIIQTWLLSAGLLMTLAGGLWAVFENHLGRIMGFAAMVQIGTGLLAVSLKQSQASNALPVELFFIQLIPMGLAMAVWGLALSVIQGWITQQLSADENHLKEKSLHFNQVQGIAVKLPLATLALIICNLSMAGVPLLAGFPAKISLLLELYPQSHVAVLTSVASHVGLFCAGMRTLAALVRFKDEEKWVINEAGLQAGLLGIGVILILVIGIIPNLSMLPMINAAQAYIPIIP